MRIAISTDTSNGLDSVVSPHFGRCPFFTLVDVQDQEMQDVQVIENPFYGSHSPGQVPAFIRSQGVNLMLTGGMGRRAIQLFAQYGIEPATGAVGTVRLSLERYFGGELRGAAPCAQSKQHDQGYEHDEVGRLREEAEMLRAQLDEAAARLRKLRR